MFGFVKKTKKTSLAEQVSRTERAVKNLNKVNEDFLMSLQYMTKIERQEVAAKRS